MKSSQSVEQKTVKNVRGGIGEVLQKYYLKKELPSLPFSAMNVNEMAPGATIPEHRHDNDEEYYLVIEGEGTGILDGKEFPVKAGDGFFCKAGSTHGILNNTVPGKKLTFISVFFA